MTTYFGNNLSVHNDTCITDFQGNKSSASLMINDIADPSNGDSIRIHL